MEKVTLSIDGTQVINTLNELNELLEKTTENVIKLKSAFKSLNTVEFKANIIKTNDIFKGLSEGLEKAIEQSQKFKV